jgi:hypothetical protein
VIPDPAPPYEFDVSGDLKDRLRRMLARASQLGIGYEVAVAFREIIDSVTNRPRSWGDPLRHFGASQMIYYRGSTGGFAAVYSVHDRIPMSFLYDIVPLPGHPMYGESFDDHP